MKYLITGFLTLAFYTPVSGEVLFSDDLNSYSTWDGCPNDTILNHLPSVKYDEVFGQSLCGVFSIVEKSPGDNVFNFTWPENMSSKGIAVDQSVTGGLGEIYIGWRWRKLPGWSWGTAPNGSEAHKWIYLPETGGERTMLSMAGNIAWFDGNDYDMRVTDSIHDTNSAAWLADYEWHEYIALVSPATSTIRVWYDGVELSWSQDNNGGANFTSTTFDNEFADNVVFGYQSRNPWPAGNTSQFDDLIIATTKTEIDDWFSGNPAKITCYLDADGDLYSNGTSEMVETTCSTHFYTADQLLATFGDCNDNDSTVNPGVYLSCNASSLFYMGVLTPALQEKSKKKE